MDRELILLKIRNLVADKEMCIANANMENAHRDGWSGNWNQPVEELNKEIDRLMELLK